MWLIVRAIAFSLPGIARAENTTVSSGPSLTKRWSSMAMRGQRRLRLALRAGRDAEHVLRRVVRHVRVANLHAGRDAQVAEPLRDLGVLHDAAADEGHLALELRRQVDQHLHPVDARREGRHHQLAVRAREELLERVDDLDLRAR